MDPTQITPWFVWLLITYYILQMEDGSDDYLLLFFATLYLVKRIKQT